MSGEALRQEIRRTSAEKAGRLLEDAKAQAAAVVAQAESEAKAILDKRADEAQRRAEQIERSEAAKARMECAKMSLDLQSRFVESAFSRAEARLKALPEADPAAYESLLAGLIEEALGRLGEGELTVVAREADRKLVEKILARSPARVRTRATLSNEALDAAGGVVLRSEDRRLYYVSTFESRMLRAREELRAYVVEALERRE